jgi:hypothetical protein
MALSSPTSSSNATAPKPPACNRSRAVSPRWQYTGIGKVEGEYPFIGGKRKPSDELRKYQQPFQPGEVFAS